MRMVVTLSSAPVSKPKDTTVNSGTSANTWQQTPELGAVAGSLGSDLGVSCMNDKFLMQD